MSDDKLDKTLGYRPDIKYEEDYITDYTYIPEKETVDKTKPLLENNYVDHINSIMNDLANMIPGLNEDIQNVVNQVFKPIYDDWKESLSKNKYPAYIPDMDDIIIIKPVDPPTKPDSDDDDPIIEVVPGIEKNDPEYPDLPDDTIFDPPKKIIEYPKINMPDIIQLEYIKNLMDLYGNYVDRLKDILSMYYLHLFQAAFNTENEEEITFILNKIDEFSSTVKDENVQHLMDASLRSEVLGALKLSFCENAFNLESTLYHLKTFYTVKDLRLRYYTIQKDSTKNKETSSSNKTLEGMRITYDRKYDDSYINFYKYLNSSLVVLDDVLQSFITGFKTKSTLLKKGGIE